MCASGSVHKEFLMGMSIIVELLANEKVSCMERKSKPEKVAFKNTFRCKTQGIISMRSSNHR